MPKRAGHERAHLVEQRKVAARREDVDDRLRGEHLADRRGERRPARLGPDPVELCEHLVEPVAGALGPQGLLDSGHDARRHVVAGGQHRDARDERAHDLVADVLVHEVGRLPEHVDVDAGIEADAAQRLGERLARDAVEGERERIDRAGDELGARTGGGERGGESAAAGALRVDPHGQPARLAERPHELLRGVRLQRAGRVVEQDAHRAELGQHLRALDQRLDLAGAAGAVDEPGLEVAVRRDDRLGGLAQVRDVVEGVVEPEDVDAVRGGRSDEAAGEVGVDRTRADEEAAAQREPERRLDARLEGADPLPRALDAALDRRVEAAAARDLEVREAGLVQDLREPQLLGRRDPPRERLLPEQANRRVG